eukprot:587854-Prymnesium_polylepis.1
MPVEAARGSEREPTARAPAARSADARAPSVRARPANLRRPAVRPVRQLHRGRRTGGAALRVLAHVRRRALARGQPLRAPPLQCARCRHYFVLSAQRGRQNVWQRQTARRRGGCRSKGCCCWQGRRPTARRTARRGEREFWRAGSTLSCGSKAPCERK